MPASYSTLTVVSGTTITSAWGNNVRNSCLTAETATPSSTAEGQMWTRTDTDTLYRYTGSASEAFDGYGAWTSYTPTFECPTSPANWSLGNATVAGKYRYIGGRAVAFRASLVWGSTTTWAIYTEAMSVTLPVAMDTTGAIEPLIATALVDSSAGVTYRGSAGYRSSTALWVGYFAVSGSNLVRANMVGNSPTTWANGDAWYISGIYETAA